MLKNFRLWFVLLLVFAAAIVFAVGVQPPAVRAAASDDDFIAGEVVVKLASTADLAAVAAQHSLDPAPLDQFGSRPIYRLRITDGASVETRVDQLLLDTRVIFAEPN